MSEKLKTFSIILKNIDKEVRNADIYGNEIEEDKGEDQWSLLVELCLFLIVQTIIHFILL